jgi:hypothetical protein
MNRMGSVIRLMLCLPQMWIALVATGVAIVANNWETLVDIAIYALWRLLQ